MDPPSRSALRRGKPQRARRRNRAEPLTLNLFSTREDPVRHGAPRRARSHGAAWGSGAATVCRPARRVRRGATLRTEPAEVRDPMGRAAGSGHELANRSTQARMRKRGGGRDRCEPHDAQPCGDRRTRLFSVISVSLWPPLRSSASLPRLCRVLVWLRLCRAGPQSHREHGEETAPWRSGGVNDYEDEEGKTQGNTEERGGNTPMDPPSRSALQRGKLAGRWRTPLRSPSGHELLRLSTSTVTGHGALAEF